MIIRTYRFSKFQKRQIFYAVLFLPHTFYLPRKTSKYNFLIDHRCVSHSESSESVNFVRMFLHGVNNIYLLIPLVKYNSV